MDNERRAAKIADVDRRAAERRAAQIAEIDRKEAAALAKERERLAQPKTTRQQEIQKWVEDWNSSDPEVAAAARVKLS